MSVSLSTYLLTVFSPTYRISHLFGHLLFFLSCTASYASLPPPTWKDPASEDPVILCKEIINGHPEHWGSGASESVFSEFGPLEKNRGDWQLYQLLESPGITLDAEGESEQISREQLLEVLRIAANEPRKISRIIAEVTLQRGLKEYKQAYDIASKFLDSGDIAAEEAIAFLDHRYGYAKLEEAKGLKTHSEPDKVGVPDHPRVQEKLKALGRSLPNPVSQANAIQVVYEFYSLLEEERIGLGAYEPYRKFRAVMEELNRSRIAQRRIYRSSISILKPESGTVWQLNEPVTLEWETTHIGPEKSLRFFLVKGEMVVQELGKFKNVGVAENIRLNKNIDSGDDYRVVAIEMFPANKYYIAKVASPPFSIQRPVRKPPADRLEEPLPAMAGTKDAMEPRATFDGRSISYVKELTVDAGDIRISIWDHGRQDKDIVSIYLNGSAVVSRHSLTYRKSHFDVHLENGSRNDLFLYAHNLGQYPPNTVSIEIAGNTTSENIVLNSDLKSCEAVLIHVRP